jgi:hypothetical protein
MSGHDWFVPSYALGFTDIRLPLENTLITLQRLHSLAFGFETFIFQAKDQAFLPLNGFPGNLISVQMKYMGLMQFFRKASTRPGGYLELLRDKK